MTPTSKAKVFTTVGHLERLTGAFRILRLSPAPVEFSVIVECSAFKLCGISPHYLNANHDLVVFDVLLRPPPSFTHRIGSSYRRHIAISVVRRAVSFSRMIMNFPTSPSKSGWPLT